MWKMLLDLAPYLAGFVWAAVTLLLVLDLKRNQKEAQLRWTKRQQTLLSELGLLRSQVQELRVKIDETEHRSQMLVPPPAPVSGLNLSRRTQALRLLRR